MGVLDALDEDALMEIMVRPKNALVKQYRKLFEMEDDPARSSIPKRDSARWRKHGAGNASHRARGGLRVDHGGVHAGPSCTRCPVQDERASSAW